MRKIINFSAGPGMLPEDVLLQMQSELLDWRNTGMSIMEVGHRGPEFKHIVDESEADLRELMSIPNDYSVFFLPGGASAQFAMVPLNLMGKNAKADYIDTGIWSKKAIAEASRYGEINVAAAMTKQEGLAYIPGQDEWQLNPNAAYVHYTPNETIEGIEFSWVPKTGDVPLIADMSSVILSKPMDVRDYGIIYAGAQKNIGQAGIAVVIIRNDLLQLPMPRTPTLYTYLTHAENHSLYNTPPTFSWYVASLVFKWIKKQGGVEVFTELNARKARKLYAFIDSHQDFYVNHVHPSCRSRMNVVFQLKDETLTTLFLDETKQAGLTNLRGHKRVGGMRASLYNAMPESGVDALIQFMGDFAKRYG